MSSNPPATPTWQWSGKPATRESVQADVPRGWRPLVGRLYDDLVRTKWDGKMFQAKEKFGTLRFYTGFLTDEQQALITLAGQESAVTCEVCSAPGKTRRRSNGWLNTLCELHDSDPRPAWQQALGASFTPTQTELDRAELFRLRASVKRWESEEEHTAMSCYQHEVRLKRLVTALDVWFSSDRHPEYEADVCDALSDAKKVLKS